MYRVMFICTGNICRSPLAHAVFEDMIQKSGRESEFFIESAGTDAWHQGEPADSRMRQTAARHGLKFHHRSRHLVPKDLEDYDLLLVMDQQNYRKTAALAANAQQKARVKMFRDYDPDGSGEVPDPWYGGMDGFEEVWHMVERTCRAMLEQLPEQP